ncbi:MAG: hypothetical protein JSV62_04750 [Promethearchaeota archaeon]|nr:MAG: hypothetical protein JSV62_04750 [Candidatus Lokiarchaeota archaeon]
MATYKTLRDSTLSPDSSYLMCDFCGSEDIVSTTGGYVCRKCGNVLDIPILQYDRPYNEEIIQYSIGLGKTQIGTERERVISPHSKKLRRLNKQNIISLNKDTVIERAKAEISNVFSKLNLSEFNSIKDMVLEKFKEIRPQLRKGTKFRNTEKLVGIISYFCLKLRNVSINIIDLIEASDITRKEFNNFCLQVRRYLPHYADRNRREYILQRVFDISEHFNLSMDFYHLAENILTKLWHFIKNTTDNALAGLVSSISLICNKIEGVSVSAVCTRLGIRMSTIQLQVKKKIVQKFRVEGFISLIKSSDLLIKIMEKLGLLDTIQLESDDQSEELYTSNQHVELLLGNGPCVFNCHDELDYYYFAIRSDNNVPVLITLDNYDFYPKKKPNNESKLNYITLPDFEVFKYYNCKGPPSLCGN